MNATTNTISNPKSNHNPKPNTIFNLNPITNPNSTPKSEDLNVVVFGI